MSYAHKGEILPLVNQMIPIDKETTFHASYDYHLNGMNQGEVVSPLGETNVYKFNGRGLELTFGKDINVFDSRIEVEVDVLCQGTGQQMVFSTKVGNGASNNQRFYFGTTDGAWDIGIQSSSWSAGGAVSTSTSKWVKVRLESGNGTAKLYVDGVLSRTKTYTSYTIPDNFAVGAHASPTDIPFTGYLSNLKIWVNGELKAWYRMNEKEGSRAYDSSSYGNDVVWSNTLSRTTGPTVATLKKEEGKFRGAVLIEPETSNILANPSMSTSTASWTGYPTQSGIDYHKVSHENGAGKIEVLDTSGNSAFHNYAFHQTVATTSTSIFTGSVWIKATKGTTIGIRLCRNTNDGTSTITSWGGDDTVYGYKVVEATGSWERIHVTINPYGGTNTLVGFHIRVGIEKAGTIRVGDVAYIKNIQLERRDYPTSFVEVNRPLGKLWYPNELVNPSAFTISCWFNIPHVHAQSAGNTNIHGSWYHPIIEVAPDIANGVTGLSLTSGPAPSPWSRKFTLFVDGTTIEVTGSVIQDNTWYHLTCTFDGTTYTVYLDGVQVKTYAKGPFTVYDNSYLMVGGGYLGKPFSMIDELRIERRAISADEAAAWAASGLHYNYLDYSDYVD